MKAILERVICQKCKCNLFNQTYTHEAVPQPIYEFFVVAPDKEKLLKREARCPGCNSFMDTFVTLNTQGKKR